MKIDVIVVIYQPNKEELSIMINSIISQVSNIIIVDNSDNVDSFSEYENTISQKEKIHYYPMKRNRGIAFSQNFGIKKSITNNSDFIILSYQDTIFPETYVKDMLKEYEKISLEYNKIAAIAPSFVDYKNDSVEQGFNILNNNKITKINPIKNYYELQHAIASGLFLVASQLINLPLMKEELFIDWVDTEWCWRINNLGYNIIGTKNIKIKHKIGNSSIEFKKKFHTIHNEFRLYYIIRNAFYIIFYSKDITKYQKSFIFNKSIRYIIRQLVVESFISNIKVIIKAVNDAALKKLNAVSCNESNNLDILMATYNGEKYIREQIESIQKQTYTDWRLLIRDDGSTDNTLNIISEYEKNDSRLVVIKDNLGNIGVASNFETLLKLSDSQYIMFSDQDDVWDKDKIETLYRKIKKMCRYSPCLVHSDAMIVNEKLDIIKSNFLKNRKFDSGLNRMICAGMVQGSSMMFNERLKEIILPFPEKLFMHDYYISLACEKFGKRKFISKSLMLYRQHLNNSIGIRVSKKKIKNIFKNQIVISYEKNINDVNCFFDRYKKILSKKDFELYNKYLYVIDKKNKSLLRIYYIFRYNLFPIKRKIRVSLAITLGLA